MACKAHLSIFRPLYFFLVIAYAATFSILYVHVSQSKRVFPPAAPSLSSHFHQLAVTAKGSIQQQTNSTLLIVVYTDNGCLSNSLEMALQRIGLLNQKLTMWYLGLTEDDKDILSTSTQRKDRIGFCSRKTLQTRILQRHVREKESVLKQLQPDLILHILPSAPTIQQATEATSHLLQLIQTSHKAGIQKHFCVSSPESRVEVPNMPELILHSVHKMFDEIELFHLLTRPCRRQKDCSSSNRVTTLLIRHLDSLSQNGLPFNSASMVTPEPILVSSLMAESKKKCFVMAVFGSDSKQVDEIPDTSKAPPSILNDNEFLFYAFTNLENLHAPGWNKILLSNLTFANHVISSRLPKFMAWKVPELSENCHTVFYSDGGWLPAQPATIWREYSDALQQSDGGLLQYTHTRASGPLHELEIIKLLGKDTKENVDRELDWLRSQPDLQENSTFYCNMAFGYAVENKIYRKLSQSFWKRYSQGQSTYRDQPSWNYWIQHYNITPLYLGRWTEDLMTTIRVKGRKNPIIKGCCWLKYGKSGYNNHKYVKPLAT